MKKKTTRSKTAATKRGQRTAKSKRRPAKKDDFIGRLNGVFKAVGDIEAPAVPLEDWEALR
jgi:hypothetical protein